jgi:hypothetical protein
MRQLRRAFHLEMYFRREMSLETEPDRLDGRPVWRSTRFAPLPGGTDTARLADRF